MHSKIPMLLLCGDSYVGKTSFRNYLCNRYFSEHYVPTLGVDFSFVKETNSELDNTIGLEFQIWDFSGNNTFKQLMPEFMVSIDYFIIMYDCSNRTSFLNVSSWLTHLTEFVNVSSRKILVVANKIDLRTNNPDCISSQEAAFFIHDLEKNFFNNKQEIHFLEISVKTGKNLTEIISYLSEIIVN